MLVGEAAAVGGGARSQGVGWARGERDVVRLHCADGRSAKAKPGLAQARWFVCAKQGAMCASVRYECECLSVSARARAPVHVCVRVFVCARARVHMRVPSDKPSVPPVSTLSTPCEYPQYHL